MYFKRITRLQSTKYVEFVNMNTKHNKHKHKTESVQYQSFASQVLGALSPSYLVDFSITVNKAGLTRLNLHLNKMKY